MATWVHTHLPRLNAGDTPDVISVKIPGQRVEYACWIALRDAEFRVHERGRQRCITQGVRNVHAWVVGEEVGRLAGVVGAMTSPPSGWRKAVYDPWKGGSFVDSETLAPIHLGARVMMSGKDVWYVGYEARLGPCYCGRFEGESMPDSHSIAVCMV